MKEQYIGLIGTYTDVGSEGIYSFILDSSVGKLNNVKLAGRIDGPTYLAIDQSNQFVYAVAKEGNLGGIASFKWEEDSQELQEISRQLTEGTTPCYVNVNRSNTTVVSAYYHRGTFESHMTNEKGELIERTSEIVQEGSGPVPKRQEHPHAHYLDFTPDEKFVIGIDLGTDEVITFQLNNHRLEVKNRLKVKPGSGPRHLVFHPNGKYAYCLTELSNEVIVLKYHEDGTFTEVQYMSTVPDDFNEESYGSAIQFSPDGCFLYAGNRGHNSIAVFSVDSETGKIEYVDYTPVSGDWPRDFTLDPSGEFVIVANQNSNNLVLFKRNAKTGKLILLQSDISVSKPVCVKFFHK